MTQRPTEPLPELEPGALERVTVLLCDADDTLFPSESPAFDASVDVLNRYLAAHGIDKRVTAEEQRSRALGKNFRATVLDYAADHGVGIEDLGSWVAEEAAVVTGHLRSALTPDAEVVRAVTRLSEHLTVAAVSSSALARLEGSFSATGLSGLVPADRRFSAEDSLATPASKPDPAIYLHACAQLGIEPGQGLAVEDSVAGATSAVRAGCPTIGIVTFLPPSERARRREELEDVGVLAVVSSWPELTELVLPALSRRSAA
jgi:beta-phosphoglucomutase-like phosphatase (HAD superfamily)